MNYILNLPNDLFQQILLPYFTIDDLIAYSTAILLSKRSYYDNFTSKVLQLILPVGIKVTIQHIFWFIHHQVFIINIRFS